MKPLKIILVLGFALLLFSCKKSGEEQIYNETTTIDSTSNAFISSSAAVENKKDTTRRFIRTADLKFKTKSVIKSTNNIEQLTAQQDGFVTYTNLTSDIDNVTTTAVSADSSLVSTYFTVSNTITLRVPNTKLETTLKEISKNIDYLDYRIIKAEDVALQILSNNLTQKHSVKNEKRLANAIESKISNLSLADQIKFSTINLSIYQRQTVKRELVSNDKNIDEYEPSFGVKILDALKFGWNILETFIVFLIKLWGLFLFGFIAYILYKKYGQRKR